MAVKVTRSGHEKGRTAPPVEFLTLGLRCPICSTAFTSELPIVSRSVGQDSDFRPRFSEVDGAGPDPLTGIIQSCPSCHYTAYPHGFIRTVEDDEEDLDLLELLDDGPFERPAPQLRVPEDEDLEALRRWIRSGELTEGIVEGREPFGGERYLLAARCYDFLHDDDPLALADYYLRGAWSARSTGDRELEQRCLREAIPVLEKALDDAGDGEKARLTYLVAELSRRTRDFARAVDLFGQIEGLVDLDEREGLALAELARRQLALAMAMSDVNARLPDDSEELRDAENEGDDD